MVRRLATCKYGKTSKTVNIMHVDNTTVNARYIASIATEMTTDLGILKKSMNPDDSMTDLLNYARASKPIFLKDISQVRLTLFGQLKPARWTHNQPRKVNWSIYGTISICGID